MASITGDLIKLGQDNYFDVIIHGCNCFCTMGAGIAKTIKDVFPAAYQADLATPKGDRNKLGTISMAQVIQGDHSLFIVNAYSQYHSASSSVQADYQAIRAAMRSIKKQFHGKKIGYPKIGAGLAGGDWSVIAAIINEELAGEDHSLVVLPSRHQ